MATLTLDSSNFESTVLKDGIALVDCWAPWCGPCQMFGPIFAAAAEKHPDCVFGKLNTQDELDVAGSLGIQSIPTLMIFRDEILLFRQAGALPAAALDDLIAQVEALDMDEVRAEIAEQKEQGELVAD